MRGYAVAALAALVAVGGASRGHAGVDARQARLLFSFVVVEGNITHPVTAEMTSPDIYSLSPGDGRLAQLTVTGGSDPAPSPDGAHIAFTRVGSLWLMAADGSRQGRLAGDVSSLAWSPDSRRLAYVSAATLWVASADGSGRRRLAGHVSSAVWSPDGRRLAYVTRPTDARPGIHVIGADGRGARMLVGGKVSDLAWSPDGRSFAYLQVGPKTAEFGVVSTYTLGVVRDGRTLIVDRAADGVAAPSWSADGRWLAYLKGGSAAVAHPDGSGRSVLGPDPGADLRWSPVGERLALLNEGALLLLEGGRLRTLVPQHGSPHIDAFAWSPDGTGIAYEIEGGYHMPQLAEVSLSGGIHELGGAYPQASGLVWTLAPAGARYQPPQAALAAGDELKLRVPVEEIAADGGRVAYQSCGTIGVWQPDGETVTPVRDELPLCNFDDNWLQFYSLALADDQVAWGVLEGGNGKEASLTAATVSDHPAGELLASGAATSGDPRGTARVGYLLGAGPLLTFSSWTYCDQLADNTCSQLPLQQRPIASQTLWRLRDPSWPGTCPVETPARCQRLRTEPGPLRPLDADAGRIVASGDYATVILDDRGQQLLSVPVSTTAAQLTGDDLVLLVPGALRDYDAETGTLRRSWPLPDVPFAGVCGLEAWVCGSPRLRLQGAAGGLVAYLLDGTLHLLRLSDGADAVVADATAAQLTDSGLFYSYRGAGRWPGRIRFVPSDQLPDLAGGLGSGSRPARSLIESPTPATRPAAVVEQ